MKAIFDSLQIFTNYVNGTSTAGGTVNNAPSYEVDHTYWQTALIYLAQPKLVHAAFAQKVAIPQNNGKTVEWRKVSSLGSSVSGAELTEGAPGDALAITINHVTATVKQYGHYIKFTDLLELTAKDGIMKICNRTLSEQAANIIDKIDRDAFISGLTVEKIAQNGTRANVGTDGNKNLTVDDLFAAAAELESQNAPTIGGDYVAIVHPYVLKDLLTTITSGKVNFIDVAQYADPQKLIEGEVGKIGKVRVIATSNAKVHYGDGTNATGSWEVSAAAGGTPAVKNKKCVFITEVFGADALGTTEIEGGGLELITHDKNEAGGPLNQYSTAGWKLTKASAMLVPEYAVKIASNASQTSNITADN